MNPITTVLLGETWITARSGDGFAAESGKDADEKAKHLFSRIANRVANYPNSENLIKETRSNNLDEESRGHIFRNYEK